jgi:small-conductance mechanosensitive channel
MERRRIVTRFGITYNTPQDKVKQVPEIVTQIFEQIENVNLDRVHFATFGDSALIFEFVYFVESGENLVYMDVQQNFNFKLMERFAELGISFAYPTQTIYTKSIN